MRLHGDDILRGVTSCNDARFIISSEWSIDQLWYARSASPPASQAVLTEHVAARDNRFLLNTERGPLHLYGH